MSDLPPPIPAATLVLMRPGAGGGAPDLLMMERTGNMAFAAGALVFPGGRIDPDDHQAAERFDGGLEAAARIAAIRETIEETGLAPGLLPEPSAEIAADLRRGLDAEELFSTLLARHDLEPDMDALVPFARWCPNFRETRRFDALFFLAVAPADAPEPVHAPREAVRAFWASAADVLDEIEGGQAAAIFPTRRNLERLARFGSVEEALADAHAHPVRTITPWIEERDGEKWLCIPDDLGYPVTAERLDTARRS